MSVCVCKTELWAQGSKHFSRDHKLQSLPPHATAGSHRSTGLPETRGQNVRAACLFLLFAWGASLLNADKSILKRSIINHQAQTGMNETALCRLVSGNEFQSTGEYFPLMSLPLRFLRFWFFIWLFLMAQRERKVCSPLSLIVLLNSSPSAQGKLSIQQQQLKVIHVDMPWVWRKSEC